MRSLLFAASFFLSGCASVAPSAPQDAFFRNLAALCGGAYEGRIASPPAAGDDAFAGKRLVMQVRSCSDSSAAIPFHVGEDRSRTWLVTRTSEGLRLKHDHRHEDGSEDVLTQYGGDTVNAGTETRQEFPADALSHALFARQNIPASQANVWSMELHPGRMFAYELRRPGRFFRVEFDLTRPVETPPRPGARPARSASPSRS